MSNAQKEEIRNLEDSEEFDESLDETQLVSFKLDAEEYALDIMQVREIITVPKITKIPRAPEFIEGIIDLREMVLPIIDLRKRFMLPYKERTEDTRIVIVNLANTQAGIVVDMVTEVMRIQNSLIEPPPAIVSRVDLEFIKGVTRMQRGLVILLDIEKILSMDEMQKLTQLDKHK